MNHKYTDDDKELALDLKTNRRYKIVQGSAVEDRAVNWEWANVLPRSALSSIQGLPGSGKTFAALGFAAAVSTGGAVPVVNLIGEAMSGATERVYPGKVLYISGDDPKEVLKERVVKMGGDTDNIYFVESDNVPPLDDPELEMLFKDVGGGLTLVVIDPLQDGLGGINMNNANEVTGKLDHIKALAEKHGVCVLIIQHINKISASGKGGPAVYSGIGSAGINGKFRAVWTCGRLKDEEGKKTEKRALMCAKSSYAEGDVQSVLFTLTRKDGFLWAGVDDDLDADSFYNREVRPAHRPDDKGQAVRDMIHAELSTGQKISAELKVKVMAATGCCSRTYVDALHAVGGINERDKALNNSFISRLAG